MKKSELKEIMKKHCIIESELQDICDFVSEILYKKAKELEVEEPYATNTIQKYESAAYEAFDLIDYLEEIIKGED